MPGVKKIRVLLDEQDATKETKFIVKSRHGFVLESPTGSGNTAVHQEKELHIVCKNKRLFLQCRDKKYRRIKYNSIEICDPHRTLTLGSITYQGSIIICIHENNDKVLVINKLPLEDYIYSVVRYESIPSWPLGMQKIQAIISRTYAVYLMQQAALKPELHKHFDIRNTNLHQVYNGTHTYTHLRQAIDETENVVVMYKNNVALTMFDICCGGASPSLMKPQDTSKPYLNRKQVCTHCSKSPSYRWKEDIHVNTFLQGLKQNSILASKLKTFKGPITDVFVSNKDKAGLAHKIKIFDKDGKPYILTGNQVRGSFLSKIKSLSFSIKKVRDRIVISGKGYGHQRGVCQWGCKDLIEHGWSIKSILNFYYPGTKLSKLSE